jgi:hypothetical protein
MEPPAAPTRLVRVDKETRSTETVVDALREAPSDDDGPLLLNGDAVVIDAHEIEPDDVTPEFASVTIRRYSLISGERTDLVPVQSAIQQVKVIDDAMVYFCVGGQLDVDAWIGRVQLEPAEPERLRRTGGLCIGHLEVDGGYVYWVEAHRLLRMPLPAD